MSTNNDPGEVTRRFWATLGARDWESLETFFGPDSEYWDVPVGRDNGAIGPANISARLRLGIEPLKGYRNHPERTVVDGEHVVTIHAESWEWDDQHSYTLEFASYQRVHDGLILEWRDYSDMGGLMAAAPDWWHQRLADADLSWRSGG